MKSLRLLLLNLLILFIALSSTLQEDLYYWSDGKKHYENEINATRNPECEEIYHSFDIPIIVLTKLSFENCINN